MIDYLYKRYENSSNIVVQPTISKESFCWISNPTCNSRHFRVRIRPMLVLVIRYIIIVPITVSRIRHNFIAKVGLAYTWTSFTRLIKLTFETLKKIREIIVSFLPIRSKSLVCGASALLRLFFLPSIDIVTATFQEKRSEAFQWFQR